MNLKLLLPSRVFADARDVLRIVAETPEGSVGLLPHRRDCITALAPGILSYETEADGEVFIAVDEGVLVKSGAEVRVSVRHATRGADLADLRSAVRSEFMTLDLQQRSARAASDKLESGFVSRFASFHHD